MTVVAAEAAAPEAAAAGGGEAAGASRARGARSSTRGMLPPPRGFSRTTERRREPIDSDRGGTRYLTTTTTQRGRRTQRRTTERRREPGQVPGSTLDTTTTTERRGGRSQRIHRGNYQTIILMEFVAAILLTAATPIATKKAEQGLSPYAGSDIVKLSSITLVYLILAMLSAGGQSIGRVAAWLGGLILLTDGLFEASNIAKDLEIFGGSGLAVGPAKTAVPPPQIVPTPSGQPAPNLTGSTGQG